MSQRDYHHQREIYRSLPLTNASTLIFTAPLHDKGPAGITNRAFPQNRPPRGTPKISLPNSVIHPKKRRKPSRGAWLRFLRILGVLFELSLDVRQRKLSALVFAQKAIELSFQLGQLGLLGLHLRDIDPQFKISDPIKD